MRSFIFILAVAAAATQPIAATEAPRGQFDCALNTLQRHSGCEGSDMSCYCNDENRENLLDRIHKDCGSTQGRMARNVAQHACDKDDSEGQREDKKERRAVTPSNSAVHLAIMATPAAAQQGCTCASPADPAASQRVQQDPNTSSAVASASSARNAHPATPTPSPSTGVTSVSGSSHGKQSGSPIANNPSPSPSSSSSAKGFSPFKGAASQALPSLFVSGALAAVVGVFATL